MVLAARERGLPRRSAGDRQRAVGARPARAAAREAAGGGPGAPALSRRALRLPVAHRAVGILRRRGSREKLSHRRLVDACRAQFVSYLRLREWRDVHAQLASEIAAQGWTWDPQAAGDDRRRRATSRIHQALLAGLLGNIGSKTEDGDAYQGARGIRFWLHPGSGLAKKGAALGAGRRARRDHAPLRALRGEDRAGMGRGGRRRSRDARLFRAALGRRRAAKSSRASACSSTA